MLNEHVLATQIDKPFIGCASHRLSLAIKDYLARYDKWTYGEAEISKIVRQAPHVH